MPSQNSAPARRSRLPLAIGGVVAGVALVIGVLLLAPMVAAPSIDADAPPTVDAPEPEFDRQQLRGSDAVADVWPQAVGETWVVNSLSERDDFTGAADHLPIAARDRFTGEQIWTSDVTGSLMGYTDDVLVVADFDDGDIAAGFGDGAPASVVGLDRASGDESWRVDNVRPTAGITGTGAGEPNQIVSAVRHVLTREFAPPGDEQPTSVDLRDADSGEVLDTLEIGQGEAFTVDDLVLILTTDGELTAYRDGEVLWQDDGPVVDSLPTGYGRSVTTQGPFLISDRAAHGDLGGVIVDLRTGDSTAIASSDAESLLRNNNLRGLQQATTSDERAAMIPVLTNSHTPGMQATFHGWDLAAGRELSMSVEIQGFRSVDVVPIGDRASMAWLESRDTWPAGTSCVLREADLVNDELRQWTVDTRACDGRWTPASRDGDLVIVTH